MKKVWFLAGLLAVGAFLYLFYLGKPRLAGLESFNLLPLQKEVELHLQNYDKAQRVKVYLLQGEKEFPLYEGPPQERLRLKVNPKKLGLKEGKAKAVVEVRRLFLVRDRYETESLVDYTPPRLLLLFSPYAVMNGGSGAVKVSLSEEAKLSLFVRDWEFPFYRLGGLNFFSLFAVPVDFKRGDAIRVVAVDAVGNRTELSVPVKVKRKRYPVYRIELKGREDKLVVKLSSLLGEQVSRENFVEAFKKVNEEMRRENEETLARIGKRSEKALLWKGRFLQMKKSKVISVFGEKRIYTYGGKKVSESYHWGYDLASVKHAPVEAANDGKVVFTGFIGIYGNVVVIDHGFGLMSLYAHLADFKVKKGDAVKKGQVIGYTDETGLAFGDHLHYGMMVHGIPVNPIEWWDGRWIKNAILPALQGR
ncbi:MAG: M23 family metallopeptidase [Aquificae bacterium]|nr:M23 family metallopeptidase [Aquificota bacterium]